MPESLLFSLFLSRTFSTSSRRFLQETRASPLPVSCRFRASSPRGPFRLFRRSAVKARCSGSQSLGRMYRSWASSTWILRLRGLGPAREYVEDELVPVDDPEVREGRYVPYLAGGKLLVEHEEVDAELLAPHEDFLDLALADEVLRVKLLRPLHYGVEDGDARGIAEVLHLRRCARPRPYPTWEGRRRRGCTVPGRLRPGSTWPLALTNSFSSSVMNVGEIDIQFLKGKGTDEIPDLARTCSPV